MIRLLLCDDQTLMREALRKLVEEQDDLTVVGDADDGPRALRQMRRLRPDVTLMAMNIALHNGMHLNSDGIGQDTKVVILATASEYDSAVDALRSGARGVVLKNSPPSELMSGIRAVAAGEAWLTPSIALRLITSLLHSVPNGRLRRVDLASLTNREREVLRLLGEGLSNAEIADSLVVGEATVKSHVSNVLRKLHVRNRVQAVLIAREMRLSDW